LVVEAYQTLGLMARPLVQFLGVVVILFLVVAVFLLQEVMGKEETAVCV
jgi:hypothetical protein